MDIIPIMFNDYSWIDIFINTVKLSIVVLIINNKILKD